MLTASQFKRIIYGHSFDGKISDECFVQFQLFKEFVMPRRPRSIDVGEPVDDGESPDLTDCVPSYGMRPSSEEMPMEKWVAHSCAESPPIGMPLTSVISSGERRY